MNNSGHTEGGRTTKTLSRRQQKKAAKKAERAKSNSESISRETRTSLCSILGVSATEIGAIRNSRARRFQQVAESPGRGGLTARGVDQLQRFFSNRIPEAEKPSVREMDESAAMFMLKMVAEEVDARGSHYDVPRQMTKKSLMAKGADDRKGEGEDKHVEEDVGTEMYIEAKDNLALQEEQRLGDEDWLRGGVPLANDFTLCIRSKKQGNADLDGDL